MDQFSLTENVDVLFHSLENFTQKEGVIGKPVTQGDRTFMPVVSVTVGYGGGNASMKTGGLGGSSSGNSGGISGAGMSGGIGSGTGALGLGAKLSTDAVIVIDDQSQNVTLMSVGGGGQIIDKIPQIISGMNQNKQPSGGQQGNQTGSQSVSQYGSSSSQYGGQA